MFRVPEYSQVILDHKEKFPLAGPRVCRLGVWAPSINAGLSAITLGSMPPCSILSAQLRRKLISENSASLDFLRSHLSRQVRTTSPPQLMPAPRKAGLAVLIRSCERRRIHMIPAATQWDRSGILFRRVDNYHAEHRCAACRDRAERTVASCGIRAHDLPLTKRVLYQLS